MFVLSSDLNSSQVRVFHELGQNVSKQKEMRLINMA